ncbi:MAG: hypothetical protein F6K10_05470 [Moorea sp. SIO2B7]|nr:hypothetical protein [Moorena sp. SIO2B7]
MEKTYQYIYFFENYSTGKAIQVNDFSELSDSFQNLELDVSRPTIVIVGGASKISKEEMNHLQKFFLKVIAPLAESLDAVVVDGGTDAGIMRLIGQAHTKIRATFPLIGVAAIGTVHLPDTPNYNPDSAPLEPNHTHFLLVPGSNWGDECPWISRTANILSEGYSSVTLVINGGEITWQDILYSIEAKRPIITLEGSGRTADKLAAAVRGEFFDERTSKIIAEGDVQAINIRHSVRKFKKILTEILARKN